ncbi:MAG: HNH endonuclease [Candidatus Limnocylindrus sp.]
MARHTPRASIAQLLGQIDAQLSDYNAKISGLDLRGKVLFLVDLHQHVRQLSVRTIRDAGLDVRAARERVRLYLIECCGKKVAGQELEVVAGISEYARRVRELRVEQGYQIMTGNSADPDSGNTLAPDEYMLVSETTDPDAAGRWHIANRVRRTPGAGSMKKLLLYMQENVGKVLTTEELAYVAGSATSFTRRIRQLRTEEGYAIATRQTGRPDLGVGQYVLMSRERVAEPHDRNIPIPVRVAVFERDGNTCRGCGWAPAAWTTDDPRFLELHHLMHHARGGANTSDNLWVLCNSCHDKVHAGRLSL